MFGSPFFSKPYFSASFFGGSSAGSGPGSGVPTASVLIRRALPIINGQVVLPNGVRVYVDRANVLIGDGGGSVSLPSGSGSCTGSKTGAQRFFELPEVTAAGVGSNYAADPIAVLSQ